MLQSVIVALIVGVAVVYSAWVLLPATVRATGAARLARWAAHFGVGASQAQRLQSTLTRAGSCSECARCKGCASAEPQRPAP